MVNTYFLHKYYILCLPNKRKIPLTDELRCLNASYRNIEGQKSINPNSCLSYWFLQDSKYSKLKQDLICVHPDETVICLYRA